MGGKKRIVLLALLLAAALLGCERKQPTKALPRLVMGYDEYRPYTYTDEDGHSAGIDVEIATEACRRLGRQPVFLRINWSMRDTCLKNGTVDCLWCSYSMNGREEDYDWAGPYVLGRQVVAVLKDSPIQTLSDLEGKQIAVKTATSSESLFLQAQGERLPRAATIFSLVDMEEVVAALRNNYVDACAGYSATLAQMLENSNVEYRFLEEDIQLSELGVAFYPGANQSLCQQLDQVLEEMRTDGTTRKILERYGIDADRALGGGLGA